MDAQQNIGEIGGGIDAEQGAAAHVLFSKLLHKLKHTDPDWHLCNTRSYLRKGTTSDNQAAILLVA